MVDFFILFFTFRGRLVQTPHGYRLFLGYWVYTSFSSSGFVPWLSYSQNTPSGCQLVSLPILPWLPQSHPRLSSIVVLHCLSNRCQRLRLCSNLLRSVIVQLHGLKGLQFWGPWRTTAVVVFFQVSISEWVPCGRDGFFCFWWAHNLRFPVDFSLLCLNNSLLALRLASSCIYFFVVAGVRLVPYQRDLGW